ncbi:MAG: hypothetical protein GX874_03405 [Smithella sp.]|nr:hypothetical protein [Smithella sp.]
MAEVRAVFTGAFFNIFFKLLLFKNTGVLGKQTKKESHQIKFQRVAAVTHVFHPVVEPAHLLGGFNVDGILLLNFVRLVAGDKAEQPHVFVQVFQFKFMLLVFFQIVEPDSGKVGNNDIFGKIAFLQAGEVAQSLIVGFIQTFAARFVLNDQNAFPEKIDVAVVIAEFFDRFFEAGDAFAGNAEDIEEAVPEGFGFSVFGAFPGPFLGEGQGARFDFIPGKRHRFRLFFDLP